MFKVIDSAVFCSGLCFLACVIRIIGRKEPRGTQSANTVRRCIQHNDAYMLYTNRATSDPVLHKVHIWNTFYSHFMTNRGQTPAVLDKSLNLCRMEGVGVKIHEAAMDS